MACVEYLAIKSLESNKTVIMDKSNYLAEGYRQLNNEKFYKKLDTPIFLETAEKNWEMMECEEKWIDEK